MGKLAYGDHDICEGDNCMEFALEDEDYCAECLAASTCATPDCDNEPWSLSDDETLCSECDTAKCVLEMSTDDLIDELAGLASEDIFTDAEECESQVSYIQGVALELSKRREAAKNAPQDQS